ncbi:MAG: AraC family transcriptional regulator, partial [Chloroflexi bacterium]|nr:AraC family transcriptional regulator [Chloroflexota bacterium]
MNFCAAYWNLNFIIQQPLKKVSTAAIANAVYLSESRLAHLFKAQMHISIRRYLLWLRLMDAIENIMTGKPFTAAAHEAGFADSAHLSRTFRRMFGLTLSDLFKNSQFVQVNT